MIRLAKSDIFRRKVRQDDPPDLATSTWNLVLEALKNTATQEDALKGATLMEILELSEYGIAENKAMHDNLVSFVDDACTYIAGLAEEELNTFLRQKFYGSVKKMLSLIPAVKDHLYMFTEYQRSHFSDFTVAEEPDKYVATYDPCGSGGRLMRVKNVARTKKAYPWSWGKTGVPYYCLHCCVAWEVIPIELRGYPLRVNLVPEKPEDPCIHLYYKKPELVPEEHFLRVGMRKTML